MAPITGTRTAFERRTAVAALLAGPVLGAGGVIGMLVDPEGMAGGTSDAGWGAALFGLAMFVAFCAVPQTLFGLALRHGGRRPLTATLVAAPVWMVVFGVNPLIQVAVGGFAGQPGGGHRRVAGGRPGRVRAGGGGSRAAAPRHRLRRRGRRSILRGCPAPAAPPLVLTDAPRT